VSVGLDREQGGEQAGCVSLATAQPATQEQDKEGRGVRLGEGGYGRDNLIGSQVLTKQVG
jgi:hypothetical protein